MGQPGYHIALRRFKQLNINTYVLKPTGFKEKYYKHSQILHRSGGKRNRPLHHHWILGYRLVDLVSKLIQVNPIPGLLIYEFGPLIILGDQTFVLGSIIHGPSFLSDNIRNLMALHSQDLLAFLAWVQLKMLRFDDERRLLKLMQRRRRGESKLQRICDQRDHNIVAWCQFWINQPRSSRCDRPARDFDTIRKRVKGN